LKYDRCGGFFATFDDFAIRRLGFPALRLVRTLCAKDDVSRAVREAGDGVRGGGLENARWRASSVRVFSTAGELRGLVQDRRSFVGEFAECFAHDNWGLGFNVVKKIFSRLLEILT
jgi:hypothetical protein